MSVPDVALVIALRHEGELAPWRPLRLEEPPGLALLRHNVAAVRTELNPSASCLRRLGVDPPPHVLGLFDADALPAARAVAAALDAMGLTMAPVRPLPRGLGALGGADAAAARRGARGLLPLLIDAGLRPPARWSHPVLLADVLHARGGRERLGVVFASVPEPGTLSLDDVGRAGRAGAPPAALAQPLQGDELTALLDATDRAGAAGLLLVDDGGEVAALAEALIARGRLAAWFGVARRPAPRAVLDAQVPMYVWVEPEDRDVPCIAPGRGCAFVPVGLRGEDVPTATARILELRRRGYAAVVPRFFAPVPGTMEWQRLVDEHPLRRGATEHMDGAHVAFDLPGWERAVGPELIALWTRDNRPPVGAARPPGVARRTYSLQALGTVLDGYLADRAHEPATHHARELVDELLAALPGPPDDLTTTAEYPFVAWCGTNVLASVDAAIDRRLRRIDDAPAPLIRAMQDAVLGGGKRIRPILTLVVAAAHGVPVPAAMPVALAVEWLHAASLVQDDLPAMDDDRMRRHRAAAHLRHGEGLALLAADALVALAFEDVATLAGEPAVGPARAAAMVAALARAIGIAGLVGGQARDLLAREDTHVDAAAVLEVHRRKTAPLFELAATLATTLADVPPPRARELVHLLGAMGVAFQIIDDVLDETPDNPAFGRPAGSDARRRLPTFATLVGPTAARRRAEELLTSRLGARQGTVHPPALVRLARFVLDRRS